MNLNRALCTFVLLLAAWPCEGASLPTPVIACDPALPTNTTCDRETTGTTINKPSLVVTGDVQAAICYTSGTAIDSISGGATWTSRSAEIAFGAYRIELFSQVAGDAEPATYTLSVTGGGTDGCVLGAWRSISQSSPFDVVGSTTGNGTSATLPSITTSADNALVIYACMLTNAESMTPPGGYTEETDNANGLTLGGAVKASAGATGTQTVSWTTTTDYRCIHAAFNYNAAGTRVPLPSTGAPAVSPAFGSPWEDNDQGDRVAAVFVKGSSPMTDHVSNEETADTTAKDHLNRQYVIQIGAQTVSGVLQCNVRAVVSNGAANASASLYAQLADSSGTPTSEVLLDATGTAADNFTASVHARNFPKKGLTHTMTSQTSANNDHLIIEFGGFHNNTGGQARTHTLRFGDTAAAELERDDDSGNDDYPWCDFLDGLQAPAAGPCTGGYMTLLGVGCH